MRSPTRRAFCIVAAVAVALTAACGGGNSKQASAPSGGGASTQSTTATASGDACDIVSDEVAAEVLGVEIVRREGNGEVGSGSASCIKGTAKPTGPVDDLSEVFYVSVGTVAGGAALVDQFSAQEGSEVVGGIGDRAVYLPSAGVLFVADGADGVQVQVVKAGVPSGEQDCITVAIDVFDRRA